MTKEDFPEVGSVWRHYKGDAYRVVGHAMNADDDTPEMMVLYVLSHQKSDGGVPWARSLDRWHDQVTASSRRFERLR